MKVLIAEDDTISRRILEICLQKWGYEIVSCTNGTEAWEAMLQMDAPSLAILDWMMPGMDGPDVCRQVRKKETNNPPYLILLTTKSQKENIVEGLQAGANDYVLKPFDRDELKARIQVGVRVLDLQANLLQHLKELEDALSRVKQLQGLLPLCSYCKKIRNDRNYWEQVDFYITKHSEAKFSHSVCPDCYEQVVKPQLAALEKELKQKE